MAYLDSIFSEEYNDVKIGKIMYLDDLKEFLKHPNIVIWGCGGNAMRLMNICREYSLLSNNNIEYVDSSPDKQDQSFENKTIKPPSIIKKGIHKVIVTPVESSDVSFELAKNGFIAGVDFVCISQLNILAENFVELEHIIDFVRQITDHFIFVLHSNAKHVYNPSSTEKALQNLYQIMSFDTSFEWLRKNPPHIAAAHKDLPYYSASFIENIFTPTPVIRGNDDAIINADYGSEYVNVVNGIRVTTDQPLSNSCVVHMIGPSHLHGAGVEDRYTLPSCIQRNLNEKKRNTFYVLNHGVSGMLLLEYVSRMKSASIQENDVVVINIAHGYYFDAKSYLSIRGIPFIDYIDTIQRPHDYGEIFCDYSHLNYKGNVAVSPKLADAILYVKEHPLTSMLVPDTATNPSNKSTYTKTVDNINAEANQELSSYTEFLLKNAFRAHENKVSGCVVVNCNPFTQGHYHLINIASQIVDYLYVFIVEEDLSWFPFNDRFSLVQKGVEKLNNVRVLPSGKYVISTITFPEYFDKDSKQEVVIDPSLDLHTFAKCIAPVLNISVRFVGEEPKDNITRQYNMHMKRILPQYGINCIEIPRKKSGDNVISASTVRKHMQENDLETIKTMLPDVTYEYLIEKSCILKKG